jgi:DNA recombination protein RmuC
VKNEAKKICEKYVHPPHTLDFAILFLPTEGLFAEVLRRPGLCDSIRRDHRVILSGPTTLSATLMSLQMGFRTLAIEKRSSEVWNVLGAVKTEFGKFGDALDKVKRKLNEASSSIEAAETRHRVVAGKLARRRNFHRSKPRRCSIWKQALDNDTATLELPGIKRSASPLS